MQVLAALPNGARLRARGRFDAGMLQPWTTHVEEATTALQLMEAWLLLETSINPRWIEGPSKRCGDVVCPFEYFRCILPLDLSVGYFRWIFLLEQPVRFSRWIRPLASTVPLILYRVFKRCDEVVSCNFGGVLCP